MITVKDNKLEICRHNINKSQLYFLAFLIYFLPIFLIDTMFSATISGHMLRLISYLALIPLFLKICFLDHWKKQQLLIIILSTIISFLIWRKTQNASFVFLVPLVVGAKDVNFRQILWWYLYLNVVCMSLTICFSLIHIIPNLIYYSPSRPTRYSLGMAYATYASTHYLYMVLAYCYLKFTKLNLLDYFLIVVVDCVFMQLTNTRLDFYAVLLLIPLIEIAQRAYQGSRYSQYIVSFLWMATPIMSAWIIITSYFYSSSNHLLHKMDNLFSGRLKYGNIALHRYHVTIFGQKIVEHSFSGFKGNSFQNNPMNHPNITYFFIDSSYLRMFLLWGVLIFIVILAGMTFIALQSTIDKTFVLSVIMCIVAINCMFEPYIIQFAYNPFLLSIFACTSLKSRVGGIYEENFNAIKQ